MNAPGSGKRKQLGVSLLPIEVISLEFVGCRDTRKLRKNGTLIEFAEGREVFGCKTIADAVALYRKHQNLSP